MKKIVVSLLIFFVIVSSIGLFYYIYSLKSVGSSKEEVEFNVSKGSNFYSIASDLKKSGLIKSKLTYKIYIKTHKVSGIQKGVYVLNKGMSVEKIVSKLQGNSTNPNNVAITFKEGYDIRTFIEQVTKKTNITEEDINTKFHDKEYLTSLINEYWFLTEDILNDSLYYSLEGYLYPNTYQFDKKKVTIDYIIKTMLKQTDIQLSKYKNDMEGNDYTIHQLFTLASVVELEGKNVSDRAGIARVFYNRLNANMNLGSDVTTYYGANVRLNERDLTETELNSDNGYNTRNAYMTGRLPIGPICNPSIESIKAVLYPDNNDNMYFVSDKNGKIYFSKTYDEHNNIIAKLKSDGLWYEY